MIKKSGLAPEAAVLHCLSDMRTLFIFMLTLLLSEAQGTAAPRVRKTAVSPTRVRQRVTTPRVSKPATRKKNRKPTGLGKASPLATLRLQTATRNHKRGLRIPPLKLQARSLKKLKYLRAEITKQQVKKIQKVVDALKGSSPDSIILFRGQEKRTKEVNAEVLRNTTIKKAIKSYKLATQKEAKDAAEFVQKIAQTPYPSAYHTKLASHFSKASGPELLAIKSQMQFASPYLVAATRSLNVAFGDFYMAPKIRFVYILQVPKEHIINLHGLVSEKSKTLNTSAPDHQREKEIAIPIRATEYVRAVYDIKLDKIIQLH